MSRSNQFQFAFISLQLRHGLARRHPWRSWRAGQGHLWQLCSWSQLPKRTWRIRHVKSSWSRCTRSWTGPGCCHALWLDLCWHHFYFLWCLLCWQGWTMIFSLLSHSSQDESEHGLCSQIVSELVSFFPWLGKTGAQLPTVGPALLQDYGGSWCSRTTSSWNFHRGQGEGSHRWVSWLPRSHCETPTRRREDEVCDQHDFRHMCCH